ncbi:MAG: serine kinase [Acidobacteriota bacterium]
MTVAEVAARLDAATMTAIPVSRPVLGGYASDLLSDVMANAREGDVWVTLQKHVNVVAVAQLVNLAAIVLVHGRKPDPDTVARANEHGVPILVTACSAFEAVGRLWESGLRGRGAP